MQWTDLTSSLRLVCVAISTLLSNYIHISLQWSIDALFAILFMIDFVIAFAMCYYLWKVEVINQGGFSSALS